MAENQEQPKKATLKSPHALREEKILKFWKEKDIFNKSLAKASPKGEFVFYEGPPTANGHPGIHHLEARAFKDAIPRYRTMRGFHVRRKGGWDTHGLPVELQVEKELGLKSKKEIDVYGIEKFNEKCKESVWTYVHEWEDFTDRMGYWVDLKDPYITYKPEYMESVWNVIKTADDKGLLYKDYKVVPWCPRCGTGLSSHELAQGYEDVKDLAVTVKFIAKNIESAPILKAMADLGQVKQVYFLVWTTTPWTLPGNVALAIGKKEKGVTYKLISIKANEPVAVVGSKSGDYKTPEGYFVEETNKFNKEHEGKAYIVNSDYDSSKLSNQFLRIKENVLYKDISEKELMSLSYEPLYPFIKDNGKAFKVYADDFVTTADGTGIVHIAPMYGQDDFELGNKVGLPKYHLVNEDGTFKKETGFLAGKFVKDEATDVEIIKDLAGRGLLFHKEKHAHSYPHCWRCHTPLIYFARDSWYIRMSELRHKLVKENEGINWEPSYIKEGRFGEWLREVKDWAISRERYWGTPLPVWVCEKCGEKKVAGSIADISRKPRNTYYVMRHGQSENNIEGLLNSDVSKVFHLTQIGQDQAKKAAVKFKGKIDLIFSSPFPRAKETAEIFAEGISYDKGEIIYDERLREMGMGELEGSSDLSMVSLNYKTREDFFTGFIKGVENRNSIKRRTGSFLDDIEKQYKGKTILIVSHDGPLWMLEAAARSLDIPKTLDLKPKGKIYIANAEIRKLDFTLLPHNTNYELDLHRPYIDEVKLPCSCGGEMKRVKEVMDVWFDSGSMPFAQDHYPFENKKLIDGSLFKKAQGYPADFISEAIDQTRGWFYTLHAIGTIMGKGKAFKNVICLGHVLDAQGKKMSKSIGNVVDPWIMMDKYGADALRFWMYSINQPGESKNFDEKTVDEIIKKVFNLAANVASFYKMYAGEGSKSREIRDTRESQNILDRWIIARLDQVIENATANLDKYVLLEPTRAIRDFIADLSQWYLRRSRDRFKEEGSDKQAALATTKYVLLTLTKVMAPFTPFFAEELYQDVGGEKESVHLEDWPVGGKVDSKLLKDMEMVRSVASKGFEARMTAKLNVRQPLASLKVKLESVSVLDAELVELIKDEVNVKNVEFVASLEKDVALDTTITPVLKEEGDLRELLRKIQDLRKEKGLKVGDRASLIVPAELKSITDKYGSEIKKATGLVSIEIGIELMVK